MIPNLNTFSVAHYDPAYYQHSFIINQAEGPNKYTPIAFVLDQVRLILILCSWTGFLFPRGFTISDPDCKRYKRHVHNKERSGTFAVICATLNYKCAHMKM